MCRVCLCAAYVVTVGCVINRLSSLAGSQSGLWGPTVEGPSGGHEEVHVSAVNLYSLGEKQARGNLSSLV